jgi:uncharacterized MAPEG superfamily protein
MQLVHIVVAIALIEFIAFGFAVGGARVKYNVPAPSTSGNEIFERYYRVQMNTLEQLIVFVPAVLLYATYWSPQVAAGLGAVFVVGRALYYFAYIKDPKKRGAGFGLTLLPNVWLVVGTLVGAVRALL